MKSLSLAHILLFLCSEGREKCEINIQQFKAATTNIHNNVI